MLQALIWYIVVPAAAVFVIVQWIVPLILRFMDPDAPAAIFLAGLVNVTSSLLSRLRPAGDDPADPAGPAELAPPGTPAGGRPAAPLPPPPVALPPPSDGAPEGVPSAGGAQSDLLYAVDALVNEASRGNILAVRRVIATMSVAEDGFGRALGRLGTRLQEPDKDYGPGVFEGVLQAASQSKAAGMVLANVDAMLVSLLNRTVREATESPQRVPHNSQLNSEGPAA